MADLSARLAARHQRDYSPVPWTEYFDEAHDLAVEANEPAGKNNFRVYLRNFKYPLAPKRQFNHRLDPSDSEMTTAELNNMSQIPTLVLLHGGGYSGLTWAQFTRNIERLCQCRVLAVDLRAHGDTQTTNDLRMDIDTLVSDVFAVTQAVHEICGFPETPKVVLIGHSMGGAISVKCAIKCEQHLPSLAGFVVIDVVEGTAKDALPLMMSVIRTRPTRFPSLSNAIEWAVRSGMTKNGDSARVSMPGNLINIETNTLSIHDPSISAQNCDLRKQKFSISSEQLISNSLNATPRVRPLTSPRVAALKGAGAFPRIPEPPTSTGIRDEAIDEDERPEQNSQDDLTYKRPLEVEKTGYVWRTNLSKTEPFWNGWFDGLSSQLLDAPVQGKFLLLAGIDRLDKTLTIGQMQGKFMMKVLPKCGHAVHEDVPEQVASTIGDFLIRNKFTKAVEV